MAEKISSGILAARDPKAHNELLRLEGLDRIIEIESDGVRHSALVRFSGDGEPDAELTLHYGPDTGSEWLEF